MHLILFAVLVTTSRLMLAGPAEFGWAELRKAAADRGIPPRLIPMEADVSSTLKAEGFELEPARISGGDLRGVMYGLLEAAEQIRNNGKIVKTKAEPLVSLRGVRLELGQNIFEEQWFHSREFWSAYFAGLAQARINRLQLEFAVPPFPYLVRLPLFESVSVENVSPFARGRNLDALKQIAGLALDFAVDLAIGIRSFEMPTSVTGLARDLRLPYIRSALESLLAEIHAVRAVALQSPAELQEPIGSAVASIGRLVTIESGGEPLPANWRSIQELAAHQPMPPLASIQGGRSPVLRRVAKSRFADPEYARLTARCVALGAMGIEVAAPPSMQEPEDRLTYFAWGRLAYDPTAPDLVWRSHPLDDAMAGAARTYPRRAEEKEIEAVQRLHWNASQIERAIHRQPSSPLVDSLRAAADRARYEGRSLWGRFLLEQHGKAGHESYLLAALREFQAAKILAARLQLPVAPFDEWIASTNALLPKQPQVESALPWQAPPARPNVVHRPFSQAEPRKPLAVPLLLPPGSAVTRVSLRYRMLEASGGFQTLDADARAPRFTIPASTLDNTGTLLYYFELHYPEGVWLYPDPAVDPPAFQTRIKAEAVKKQP